MSDIQINVSLQHRKNYCQINDCYVITLIHRMACRKDILLGVKCYVSEWKCMFLCEDFIPYSFWFKWPCVVVFLFWCKIYFVSLCTMSILNLYFTNFFKEVHFFLKSYSHFHWLNVGCNEIHRTAKWYGKPVQTKINSNR